MSSSPVTFTVVVPLFNKAAYVEAAITSALSQTYPASEVVVVDDGSTDAGPQIVEALGHPKLRLVRQPNAGVAAARNTGIGLALGDFVAFLDADDLYAPEFLETLARLHKNHPEADMLCTSYEKFDDKGSSATVQLRSLQLGKEFLISRFHRHWSECAFTFTSAIAIRTTVLNRLQPTFPVGERLGEDQDVWFRVSEQGQVAFCNIPLSRYRVAMADSATATNIVSGLLPCYLRLQERLATGAVPPRMRQGAKRLVACHRLNVARSHAQARDFCAASNLLLDRRSLGHLSYWLRTAFALLPRIAAKRILG